MVERVREYAIFMLDPNGIIISWNVGAKRIFGYREEEIVGQSWECLFTPEAIERSFPKQELRTAVANRMSGSDCWYVRKDGTPFWANNIITPLRDRSGNLCGFTKILQDLNERKQVEEEREQLLLCEQAARESAEAANRSKDEFLAVVSHELRTPMTAIVGWAGMLEAGKLDEPRTALAIETIARNANLQMQLIDDLLDIFRIVRGDLSLNWDTVELPEVVTAALRAVQPAADTKDIELEFVQDQSSGSWEEPNFFAQIQVTDTGIGIDRDFLPYVFDRFRQANSASTRAHKGLGLGLAIARHIVELHGGAIEAESLGKGYGATFRVLLPLMSVVPEAEVARGDGGGFTTHALPLDRLRILVVDDEVDAQILLSTWLEECGAEVTIAGSVDEAIKVLEHSKPDVLVSDIGMPDKDGYVPIRHVKQIETETEAKIGAIALTAYARKEDRSQALQAGFQVYLTKPVEPNELMAAIASLAQSSDTRSLFGDSNYRDNC